jgi:hypothetical protein
MPLLKSAGVERRGRGRAPDPATLEDQRVSAGIVELLLPASAPAIAVRGRFAPSALARCALLALLALPSVVLVASICRLGHGDPHVIVGVCHPSPERSAQGAGGSLCGGPTLWSVWSPDETAGRGCSLLPPVRSFPRPEPSILHQRRQQRIGDINHTGPPHRHPRVKRATGRQGRRTVQRRGRVRAIVAAGGRGASRAIHERPGSMRPLDSTERFSFPLKRERGPRPDDWTTGWRGSWAQASR